MRRLVLLVIAALLLTGTPAVASPAALRVLSFNIHTGIGVDNRLDLTRVAQTIRATKADVVGLQEVDVHWSARSNWADQASSLASELGMHKFFAPIYDLDPLEPGKPRRQFGVMLLSRFPILSAENHKITRLSTQSGNPVPELMPGFPEIVLDVRGVRTHVYTTHLDYRGDPAVRRMQVADTLKVLGQDRGAPRILVGDFNAGPDAPELSPLWTELSDGWLAVHGRSGGLTYPVDPPEKRIDYITASSARFRSMDVLVSPVSDHLPVLGELVLPRPRSPWGSANQVLRRGTAAVPPLAPIAQGGPYPGAVVLGARNGVVFEHSAFGDALRHNENGELPPASRLPMRPDTIFDVASISKLFTSVVALQFAERGRVDLDAPVARYLPEFAVNGKETVTLRHVLTHTSGLPAGLAVGSYPTIPERLAAIYRVGLRATPGTRYEYSDLSLIIVGKVLERVSGRALPELVSEGITEPLRLRDTMFTPPSSLRGRIAPTQVTAARGLIWGVVHDSTSWYLGGTAGHAGVFSTAADLAVFAQMLLNGGRYGSARVLSEESVRAMTTNWNAAFAGADRGLGLDIYKHSFMGAMAAPSTVGHTGFTGTSLVIDPDTRSILILMTNRVHPTSSGPSVNPRRQAVADAVARSVPVRPLSGPTSWFAASPTSTLTAAVKGSSAVEFGLWVDTEPGDTFTLETSADGVSWQPLPFSLRDGDGAWSSSGTVSGFLGRSWARASTTLPATAVHLRWWQKNNAEMQGRGVYVDAIRIDGKPVDEAKLVASGFVPSAT
ncbi:serine hydrolase [Allokutzneria sp. A3M-2-11 16]|uniref:serine hydrolase n=1 Tax=Allokutzneria sp. A3M-2-11 16 TaxID=2962043 RepID=UPI0020B6CEA4|nr:serine hydrolase [Allokutzneria sp. A3M-2-11 16]MCP3799478.1 serine hydrolase [Allokutzneria sp. A3M-2-11 16]